MTTDRGFETSSHGRGLRCPSCAPGPPARGASSRLYERGRFGILAPARLASLRPMAASICLPMTAGSDVCARISARPAATAPELTSTFLSLCAACFLGAILTGFWSLWAAFIVSGAGFAYAGYCNAPTGDEYGADGL